MSTVYHTVIQINLCPLGLVDRDTNDIMRMFGATGGIKNLRTPGEYFNLPAFWVSAVDVIESEIHIIKKLKAIENANN